MKPATRVKVPSNLRAKSPETRPVNTGPAKMTSWTPTATSNHIYATTTYFQMATVVRISGNLTGPGEWLPTPRPQEAEASVLLQLSLCWQLQHVCLVTNLRRNSGDAVIHWIVQPRGLGEDLQLDAWERGRTSNRIWLTVESCQLCFAPFGSHLLPVGHSETLATLTSSPYWFLSQGNVGRFHIWINLWFPTEYFCREVVDYLTPKVIDSYVVCTQAKRVFTILNRASSTFCKVDRFSTNYCRLVVSVEDCFLPCNLWHGVK